MFLSSQDKVQYICKLIERALSAFKIIVLVFVEILQKQAGAELCQALNS